MAFIFVERQSFSLIPIVLVIMVFLLLVILNHHPFHDFETPFEGNGVKGGVLIRLFLFLLFLLKFSQIRIEYVPLGSFPLDGVTWRRLSPNSSCSNDRVGGLALSHIVVKLVPQGLLDSLEVFLSIWLFLFESSHCVFDECLSGFNDFLLGLCLIGVFVDQLAVTTEVNN